MIPWNTVGKIGLRIIQVIAWDALRKADLTKKLFDLIKRYDESFPSCDKLRKEYDAANERCGRGPS